eukprot:5431902-Amphidinium_carterae.1
MGPKLKKGLSPESINLEPEMGLQGKAGKLEVSYTMARRPISSCPSYSMVVVQATTTFICRTML